ncbi:MAG: helix-turn-helix transcriptional regulator [Elusimicrobiaceae bacterium]|nr:helix-turn-helix transcriptional regulator [Elusimicrobiaceae bacterium]
MGNIRIRIANNVKKIRSKLNISQAELAFRAGLHDNYIGRIESAKCNISVETLEKLGVGLNVKLEQLIR